MALSLTQRDAEILDALVRRVRVFSLGQIARTWWAGSSDPRRPASARLSVLQEEGLISSYSALSHPEIPLLKPVVEWRPGDRLPDFSSAAYQVQQRWKEPFASCLYYFATKRGGILLGGCGGRRSRQSEQTHDLHMAAVFLRYRSTAPHLVKHWRSEALILRSRPDRREKLPDAIISDRASKRIVEFGGAYTKEKLARFHQYCVDTAMPYEIW